MDDWDMLNRKLNAQRQQQAAAEQLRIKQEQAEQAKNKPTGLAAVLSGIGESIGNVGSSIGNMFGTGIASIRDLVTGNAGTGKYQNEWKDYVKENWYGDKDMSDKDYYLKTGGKALDAASTVSDFIPGLGTGAKIALNVGQGAASGAAQQLIDKGGDVTAEDLLKGGLVGAAGAGAGQAVGGRLAKGVNGKGIIAKTLNSNIGRGAATGAVAGATGGGLAAALNGGNFFGGALEGAKGGALGGATTSALYGLAGAGLDRIRNGKNADVTTMADTQIADDVPEATRRRQTALGWDEQQVDASRRNAIQRLGKSLEDAGELTQNADIYGRLNNNTARDAQKNGTIKTLKDDYGYTSKDYDRAANLSEATNAWIKNEAKASGASGYDTGLSDRVSINAVDVPEMSDKTLKSYRAKSQQLLQNAKIEGGGIDEYSAAGLYDASEQAGRLANTYYEKSHNKMDGSILNPDLDALSKAYNNLKIEARNAADAMLGGEIDDITRANLTKMLKSSGAPEQAIKTLSRAKTLSELKSMTSPLEAARNMNAQITQSALKRGATTDNSTNVLNKALKSAGAAQAIETAVSPIGQAVGKVEGKVGKFISKVGDAVSGNGEGLTSKTIGKVANAAKAADRGLNVAGLKDIATRQIAREAALAGAANVDANQRLAEAQNALGEAEADYDAAQSAYDAADALVANQAMNKGAQQLQRISDAMEAALAAGDITAYGQLADLYKKAYAIYGEELEQKEQKAPTANQSKAMTGLAQLEQLAQMTPGVGTALADSPLGFLVNLGGGDEYANQAQSLALTLGYLQSGANITPREAENIGKSYIPSAYDSEAVRQQKIARARQLLQNYIGTTE